MMSYTIIDCYTDEPAGLGVPPYLGTYPRYVAGYLQGLGSIRSKFSAKTEKALQGDAPYGSAASLPKKEQTFEAAKAESITYLTIDDIRLWKNHGSIVKEVKVSQKTDPSTYNLTIHYKNIPKILSETDTLIVILGVHVPGKYLSAIPGTLNEIIGYIKDLKCKKVLTGPAVFGTQLYGGRFFEKADLSIFDEVSYDMFNFLYKDVKQYSVKGASIISQIPDPRMIEIETGHGCDIGKCSFCTEPLKNKVEFREKEDVLNEVIEFYNLGARYFRLGKQTCFYTTPYAVELLKDIRHHCPDIKVLHIDNVNPVKVVMDKKNDFEITKAVVKYCTSGNIAAFGVESFDMEVVRANTLNTSPVVAYEAIKILNKYGAERGEDGMPRFLPGINIIFGLRNETKKTHEENMKWLKRVYDEGLMLRRINIRQVAIFEGTSLFEEGKDKFLRKNKGLYWKWRNEIRQKIDWPMLQRVVPKGVVLTNCYAEIYDGKTTFCRQFGTYPLIVGVKGRLPLKQFYDLEITGHMLRSITGKVVVKKEVVV